MLFLNASFSTGDQSPALANPVLEATVETGADLLFLREGVLEPTLWIPVAVEPAGHTNMSHVLKTREAEASDNPNQIAADLLLNS